MTRLQAILQQLTPTQRALIDGVADRLTAQQRVLCRAAGITYAEFLATEAPPVSAPGEPTEAPPPSLPQLTEQQRVLCKAAGISEESFLATE